MRIKILTLMLLTLCLFPAVCFAENKALGLKPERTLQYMSEVENYFSSQYGLSLKTPVTVYVTKSHKEYRDVILRNKVIDGKNIAETSYAVYGGKGNILIDGSLLSDKHFFFILAHELVHIYQYENIADPHSDYVRLEGNADVVASKISGYGIEIEDHGIPYEKLKTREAFFSSCKLRRNDTIEQIRFYCQHNTDIF